MYPIIIRSQSDHHSLAQKTFTIPNSKDLAVFLNYTKEKIKNLLDFPVEVTYEGNSRENLNKIHGTYESWDDLKTALTKKCAENVPVYGASQNGVVEQNHSRSSKLSYSSSYSFLSPKQPHPINLQGFISNSDLPRIKKYALLKYVSDHKVENFVETMKIQEYVTAVLNHKKSTMSEEFNNKIRDLEVYLERKIVLKINLTLPSSAIKTFNAFISHTRSVYRDENATKERKYQYFLIADQLRKWSTHRAAGKGPNLYISSEQLELLTEGINIDDEKRNLTPLNRELLKLFEDFLQGKPSEEDCKPCPNDDSDFGLKIFNKNLP